MKIKEERKKLGLIASEVAEYTGVSMATQSYYETGKRFPDSKYLAKLSELGFDLNYVVTGQRLENHLNHEEALLLKHYRDAERSLQQTVLVLLLLKFDETIEAIKAQIEDVEGPNKKMPKTKGNKIFHGDVQNIIEGKLSIKNQKMK